MAASDPDSPSYGRWLSNDAVNELVAPSAECKRVVADFLARHGIAASDRAASPNGDFVSAAVSVAAAEELLQAEYRAFAHAPSGHVAHRALSYRLPADVAACVDFVSPTVQARRFELPPPPPPRSLPAPQCLLGSPRQGRRPVLRVQRAHGACLTRCSIRSPFAAAAHHPRTPQRQPARGGGGGGGSVGQHARFTAQALRREWHQGRRLEKDAASGGGLGCGIRLTEPSLRIRVSSGLRCRVHVLLSSVRTLKRPWRLSLYRGCVIYSTGRGARIRMTALARCDHTGAFVNGTCWYDHRRDRRQMIIR